MLQFIDDIITLFASNYDFLFAIDCFYTSYICRSCCGQGIIVKVFLNNLETGVYGGFYIWESVEAMHGYVDGKNLLKTPDGDINIREWLTTRDDVINFSALKFSGTVI